MEASELAVFDTRIQAVVLGFGPVMTKGAREEGRESKESEMRKKKKKKKEGDARRAAFGLIVARRRSSGTAPARPLPAEERASSSHGRKHQP